MKTLEEIHALYLFPEELSLPINVESSDLQSAYIQELTKKQYIPTTVTVIRHLPTNLSFSLQVCHETHRRLASNLICKWSVEGLARRVPCAYKTLNPLSILWLIALSLMLKCQHLFPPPWNALLPVRSGNLISWSIPPSCPWPTEFSHERMHHIEHSWELIVNKTF